ncbi:AmiS/UreI family transporter [Planktotalea arctica]|uniref:AmiS/UreI family transporter n=1 Tax=Planktotalea arctica TaxID=1481893 RepID=UPI00321A7138
MLTGLSLLFVGAVLFINGLWMLGRIADREIIFINLFAGIVTGAVAFKTAFGLGASLVEVRMGALTLMFTATYMWVAVNRILELDGRGLGWFSLLVAMTVAPVMVQEWSAASSVLGAWLAISWGIWTVLWAMNFAHLTLGWRIERATGRVTLLSGIFTGWGPAMLLLNGG